MSRFFMAAARRTPDRGGLERMVGTLVAQVTGGKTAQFGVNDGEYLVESALVPASETLQQHRYRRGVPHRPTRKCTTADRFRR